MPNPVRNILRISRVISATFVDTLHGLGYSDLC